MREDRKIIFEHDEVYKALYTLSVAKDIKRPPAGQIQSVAEKSSDTSMIVMQIKGLDETTVTQQEYSRDFLAAALLSFCRGMNVPVPKRAKKSILVTPQNIVMRVEI